MDNTFYQCEKITDENPKLMDGKKWLVLKECTRQKTVLSNKRLQESEKKG
jgi:hypothetical protein